MDFKIVDITVLTYEELSYYNSSINLDCETIIKPKNMKDK